MNNKEILNSKMNMKSSVIWMFSGQGAQYYQMGRELFERNEVFRHWMLTLDDLVQSITGDSIVKKIYNNGIAESFDDFLYTHPAIFMVEYAVAQALFEADVQPDYVLGASMGEYVAAAVAGVMPMETCLRTLIRQAEIIESTCETGGMLTVLEKPELYQDTPLLHDTVELAAVNYAEHFVISGSNQNIETIIKFLKKKHVVFQRLPISYAFHSILIEPSRMDFTKHLKTISLSLPNTPFVSCSTVSTQSFVGNQHFWRVIRQPILFEHTIKMRFFSKLVGESLINFQCEVA